MNNKKGRKFKRKFNKQYYTTHKWLCGCEETLALYCFPCLLFGGEDAWTKLGFKNLAKIAERTKNHAKSPKHIDNMVSFNLLGKNCIEVHLSKSYQDSIDKHNQEVMKNRKVLLTIIDSVLFCGFQEIALRGHNEMDNSLNPGGFRSLLKFASKLDKNLENHFETSKAFLGLSPTIQNDILSCALEVYKKEVIHQVRQANFIAVIADETTDVSVQNQLSIVIRYINNESVVERFWGFFQPKRVNAEGISEVILNELEKILQGDKKKLIAQTYDGASVMRGRIGGVHVKVKEVYENAYYVHCAAHQLNLVLSMAASCNREAKLFFAKLDQIPTFFSKSPERRRAVEVNVPSGCKTRWNYNSKTVCKVAETKNDLLKGFEYFVNNTDCYGFSTIAAAENCIRVLNDEKFNFWLKIFSTLMPEVDVLYKVMQSTNLTVQKVEEHVKNFQDAVNRIRNSNITDHAKMCLSSSAKEVCDSISINISKRFSFSEHLRISQLFLESSFSLYLKCFPSDLIEAVNNFYPVVDCKKLKTELLVIYNRDSMHKGGLVKTLLHIKNSNLSDSFSETVKLLEILITIPMCSTEAERTFSSLKRIKTYLRNTMGQSRLNSLSVISIGRDLINSYSGFSEEVINLFINKKERRMHFHYKGKK